MKEKLVPGMKWIWNPDWSDGPVMFELIRIGESSTENHRTAIIRETFINAFGKETNRTWRRPIIKYSDGEEHVRLKDDTFGNSIYYVCNATSGYDEERDEYQHTSSTAGDYGPSNPWNAPGMSERDFI